MAFGPIITQGITQPVVNLYLAYVVGSKSFRPDQLFKVTKIKQICYFST